MKSKTRKIYENLALYPICEETEDALRIYSMAKEDFPNDPVMIAMTMHSFGRVEGKQKERAKGFRKELIQRYPDMAYGIKVASDTAISIMRKMEKLDSDDLDALEYALQNMTRE